jgi:hypothetical protein
LNFAFNGGKDIFFEFVAGEFGGGDEGRKEIDKEFPAIKFSVREDLEGEHTSPTRAQLVHQLVSRTLITTWELRHSTSRGSFLHLYSTRDVGGSLSVQVTGTYQDWYTS